MQERLIGLMRYSRIIVFLSILLSASAGAQDLPAFSLADAITTGLENNYSIRLAHNAKEVSENNATIGNAGMLPSVTLNGTLNKGIANSKSIFFNGTEQDRSGAKSTNWNANVAFDWTVFDGLAMFANYNRLQELDLMEEENLRAALQETIASVMTAYYDIVGQQQEMEATRRILQISRQRLRSANDLFRAGKVSRVDLLSAQVDYNADSASYIQQTESLRKAKIQLNNILAREITADFLASDTIVIDQSLRYGPLHDKALAENPNVVLSRMKINVAVFSLKALQGNRYPKVRLTSSYTLVKSESESGNLMENNSKTFNYGAALSMPLFNGLNINREIKNARLNKEAADLRHEEIQKDIEAQVATAFSIYEVNRQLATFETDNLGLAFENLDISMDRYRLGSISAIELREVQRSYVSAINRLIVAKYNAKIAETALKLLTGEVMRLE